MKQPPHRPLRILVLNHNYPLRGTFLRAWPIARDLARRGHDVTFAATGRQWYRPRRARHSRADCWLTPAWNPLRIDEYGWEPLSLLWRVLLVLLKRPDVVWTFSHKPVDQWPARIARRLFGARWIADWCDLWGGPEGISRRVLPNGFPANRRERVHTRIMDYDDRLENAAARDADHVTVITTFLRERATDLRGSGECIVLMRNGANTQRIGPLTKAACRRRLELPPEAPLIGYIANYHPDEDLLLDAIAEARRHCPQAKLLMAGPPFAAGENELRRRGLRGGIITVGRANVDQLNAVLGAADVLALPMADSLFNRSRWPYKVGDYMASGRPQVACAVGDVPDFFAAHTVGIATAPEPEAFGRAMAELLNDPAECERIGKAARRHAEEDLRWPVLLERAAEDGEFGWLLRGG